VKLAFYKLTIAYDGTNYSGWQVQLGVPTVQGMLEKAMARVVKERVSITGSGRTDAGVHALGQVASLLTEAWTAPPEKLAVALNGKLPPDIRVLSSERMPGDFHAIRDAVGKRYRYQIQLGGVRDPFEHRYRWYFTAPVEIEPMIEAARHLVGRHDFASFQAAGSDRKTTVRTVRDIAIKAEQGRGGCAGLSIEVEADGFLYNMVRNIVGSLLEVGRGKERPEWIAQVRDAVDRTIAGPTAPPQGLFLMYVDYK
jgi:tRNA pseudouridine38-40 synthase